MSWPGAPRTAMPAHRRSGATPPRREGTRPSVALPGPPGALRASSDARTSPFGPRLPGQPMSAIKLIQFGRKLLSDPPRQRQSPQRVRGTSGPPEPRGDDVDFRRFGAARRRLGVADRGEAPLHVGQQLGLRAALEDLGDEPAARRQDVEREGRRPPRPAPWSANGRSWRGRRAAAPCRSTPDPPCRPRPR